MIEKGGKRDRQTRERKKTKTAREKKNHKKPLRALDFSRTTAHQQERTDFLKKKKKTKKKKKETKKNLYVIMEEPEEDAPDVPPVDDENVALQHSGLHNVSNTCYLNATVQVKTFFQARALMMFEPLFVFVLFLRRNAF